MTISTPELRRVAEMVRVEYLLSERDFYGNHRRHPREATEARHAAALAMLAADPDARCEEVGAVLGVRWPRNLIVVARRDSVAAEMAATILG